MHEYYAAAAHVCRAEWLRQEHDQGSHSAVTRAYIFDNSGQDRVWLAEVTDGVELEFKGEWMPHWFKTALWDKFTADEDVIQK